jgi:plasmid stability protein
MTKKLVVDVDDELKARFKVYCAQNGTSIHEEINAFMQKTLDGQTETSPDLGEAAPAPQTLEKGSKKFDIRAFRNALNLKTPSKQEPASFQIESKEDIGLE